MDKKLLDALNNLSSALEQIADALKDKKGGDKSATTTALQSGDFSKDMVSIAAGIKSIKSDTQEILRKQNTIIGMSSKNEKKDTDTFEKAGDKKGESNIKKGVGTILLIAVAVLAIGAAFKMVGNVDFLSVIGLSLAMVIVAEAFSRVAQASRGMSLKQVMIASVSMIAISTAIMVSSHILENVSPVGLPQIISTGLIALMFAGLVPRLGPLFDSTGGFGKVRPLRLLLTMVAISTGIMASSKILAGVVPISFVQALTGGMIAAMFAVMSLHFERLAAGFAILDKANVRKRDILLFMTGISAAITASSFILGGIKPIGFAQFVTGIAISAMFAVISFHFERLAAGIVAMKVANVKKRDILFVLVGISAAITASSFILSAVKPIGFAQFLTALGIAILFAAMSYVMPMLAAGLAIMNRTLGSKKALVMVPLIFTALSLAIMLSSHILSMSAEMEFVQILKLALFGVALGILMLATLPAVVAVGLLSASGVGAGAIFLGAAMIPVIALGVALSSHILAAGNYDGSYPSIGWAAGVGLAMISFSAVMVTLGLIATTGVGAVAIAAGLLIVPLVAMSIVSTADVIRKGNYDKYPGPGWALTVGPLMLVFAAMVVALGVLVVGTLGLGGIAIQKGLEYIPQIAQSIVETARVVGTGNYDKYPGPGWALTVTPLMLAFTAMVVGLGVLSIMGLGLGALAIFAGLKWIPSIAWSIVQTASVIGKGKYDKYPGAEWALSVGGLMVAFSTMIVTVGGLIVASFGLGNVMLAEGIKAVKMIARSIVSVAWIFSNSSGAFKKGPSKEWAEGISLAMGAFSPVFKMLLASGVIKAIFGTEVTPDQYAQAIRTISQGIVDAAKYFGSKEANVAFEGGPKKEWSEGVGKAIAAFAPVYKMLVKGGIMEVFMGKGPSVEGYVEAIKTISRGIVESAKIFAENKATFDGGYPDAKWGSGVGAALKAFGPVLQGMSESSWFESDTNQINQMIYGIKKMSYAIVKVGYIFNSAKGVDWSVMPDKKWGTNLKSSIQGFIEIADDVLDSEAQYSGWAVVSVARSLSAVAKILSKNGRYFVENNQMDKFIKDARGAIMKYMALSYKVKLAVNAYAEDLIGGRDYMVPIAESFVRFSKAIASGRGSFDVPVDPKFMKNVYSNVEYYMKIIEQLRGSDMGGISGLFGNPMMDVAAGMIAMAKAFDKIATSLGKFASVMANVDDKKLKSVQNFGKSVMGQERKGFMSSLSSAAGSVVESAGGLVSGVLNSFTPGIKSSSSSQMSQVKVGKYGTTLQQMDKLIDTMLSMKKNFATVEKFIKFKMAKEAQESGFS